MESIIRIDVTIESDTPGKFFAHGEILIDRSSGEVVGPPRSKCLDCGGPQRVAPELISKLGDVKGTYFSKQPETELEFYAALEAVRICCNDSLAIRDDKSVCGSVGNTVETRSQNKR